MKLERGHSANAQAVIVASPPLMREQNRSTCLFESAGAFAEYILPSRVRNTLRYSQQGT